MTEDAGGRDSATEGRLARAFRAIDTANAEDPARVATSKGDRPAELVYGQRMSAVLDRFAPEASEALRIAVRAQHLERWKLPRASYPEGRAGYHRWRNEQKRRHAEAAASILAECGYDAATIARVQSLIRKENLKTDAEAQALEDVACLVFIEFYLPDFARQHSADKLAGIVVRTWGKMSPAAHAAVGDLPLAPELRAFLERVLSDAQH